MKIAEELILSNCGAGEDSWKSFGLEHQSILTDINSEYFRKTDAEDETSILWPPDANSQLIGKDPDAGKDWWQ